MFHCLLDHLFGQGEGFERAFQAPLGALHLLCRWHDRIGMLVCCFLELLGQCDLAENAREKDDGPRLTVGGFFIPESPRFAACKVQITQMIS